MVDFIPQFEKLLNVSIQPSQTYMLGASRGGMQMFLALSRYPELQNNVDKIISLSGLLDLETQIQNRPDMEEMFKNEFEMPQDSSARNWIDQRNPLLTVPTIRKSLPILIVQGTNDNRVPLIEGYHMVQRLQEHGNNVDYWEIEGGDHTLYSTSDRMQLFATWLEQKDEEKSIHSN